MPEADANAEQKERLIASVKKEVKQLMEEAVTRKFVHEESGGVTALCGAVEACLGQGLRRRALGLFKTSSTTALLHKIAKHCPEAALVSARVLAAEGAPATRSASGVERRPSAPRPPLNKRGSGSLLSQAPPQSRYLWIRIALFERQLAKIIEHLVSNATRYYERDALVADPDYGSILSSLLVGPCALEYSKAKAPASFWSDPPADELVQRHRMSAGTTTPPSVRRPILNFRRSLNASSDDSGSVNTGGSKAVGSSAKDYVESLHQNSTATLLYGKNNVRVQPKDVEEPMPGYLSLHQTAAGLIIKWTPNQLMNGYAESEGIDKSRCSFRCHRVHSSACQNTRVLYSMAPECTVYRRRCSGPLCFDCVYWAMSLQVCVWEVVYVHVHRSRASDALILVGQDGVQRPPIHFPKGGHLLSFLSNLETGLLPHGQLDPPLWSQRGTGKVFGRGKARRRPMPSLCESGETEEAEWEEVAGDYVFRIVNNAITDREAMRHSLLERLVSSPPRTPRRPLASTSTTSSDSSTMSVDCPPSAGLNGHAPPLPLLAPAPVEQPASIELVCSTMRRQIISRAFYGWLAYCRHLSTVRTHLSGLVHPNIVPREGSESGLTEEVWRSMTDDKGVVTDKDEVYRLVYYSGVQHEIRREVWPYLLGYYEFGSTAEERAEQDAACRRQYETTMSEWLCVEAIVRQRDREATAASIARLSEAAGKPKPVEVSEPIEVFEDDCSVISDNPPIISPEPSEMEQKKPDTKPVLSRAPSIDEVDNIEMDSEERDKEAKLNGETETGDNRDVDIDSLKDLDDDEEVHVKSVVDNPDMRRESIAEIKRLAEGIVQKGDGRGLLCSVDSANMNGNDLRSSLDECQLSPQQQHTSVIITNPSVDLAVGGSPASGGTTANVSPARSPLGVVREESHSAGASFDMLEPSNDQRTENRSNCVSPASSNGGVYSNELVESFALNLHRIEKDVQRCDRNYPFFTDDNLDKLRNIMCTYVWEHLDMGYMQGMCDLVAPLLVMMREEAVAHALFARLMERARDNFPSGQAMDAHFADMRSLIQILDCELYELMHAHGDYTHFYFCYRWFLLDFKRELLYQDVFAAWELIWAARHVASEHMVLFLALALLETYRDVILANTMDFTDIIKFFNEMAERHDAAAVLSLARDLVLQVQTLIENK
ncbi:small G protein signaling modulator 2-like isoform X2 [Plodia interpunctella]|nr:small G protein signaling modulator 2-like isoform X2 [Plodia interpunctella]XP_053617035.1 small G protein signaling modulator 2-like isoform X2 [Plodia interpunctella]